jgi:pilus assembly protein CpaE
MMIRYSRRVQSQLAALLHHQGGLSAVEFALLAPTFIFGLLMTADVGLAVSQRMSMDHTLRAGAQFAMADPGADKVLAALQATASNSPSMTLAAERYCVCPNDLTAKVSCSTICPGTVPTRAYYTLSASRTYAGMFLPSIKFTPEIQVQVR